MRLADANFRKGEGEIFFKNGLRLHFFGLGEVVNRLKELLHIFNKVILNTL